MRARAFLALLVALTAASCGGMTTAPTQPSSSASGASDLPAGSYTLRIDLSPAGDPICTPGGPCTAISVCSGTPSGPLSVSIPVRIERSGATAAILPTDVGSTFGMEIDIVDGAATGTARGTFVAGGRAVTLAGQGGPLANATGTVTDGRAAGKFDGQLSIGGYSCSNNAHVWTLSPRD